MRLTHIRRIASFAAAVVVGAACADSPTAPDPVGTYRLTQVSGIAIPATLPDPGTGTPYTVMSGWLALEKGSQWESEIAVIVGGSTGVRNNDMRAGTYRIGHDTVYLRDASDGAVYTAILAGGTITGDVSGLVFRFER